MGTSDPCEFEIGRGGPVALGKKNSESAQRFWGKLGEVCRGMLGDFITSPMIFCGKQQRETVRGARSRGQPDGHAMERARKELGS